jgi:ankyrin repeat protein
MNVVQLLVIMGADVHKVTPHDGGNIFHHIFKNDGYSLELVKLLVNAGASPDKPDNKGISPLQLLCQTGGRVDIAEFLIKKLAMVNRTDVHGSSALHFASQLGCLGMVELLIKEGAFVDKDNKDGDTPLHMVATFRSSKVAMVLIQNGADLNKSNALGQTPLHMATAFMSPEVVRVLVNTGQGADIHKKDNGGLTALDYTQFTSTLGM